MASTPSGQHIAQWLACGAGLGHLRPGPGTWGSLGAILLAVPICFLVPVDYVQATFAALAVFSLLLGLWSIPAAQERFERLDPSQVVIDEIHGIWLALALIPGYLLNDRTVMVCLIGFVGFRLFDICKPWPIPILERAPGAWGVMLDDSLAGIIAGLAVLVLVQ